MDTGGSLVADLIDVWGRGLRGKHEGCSCNQDSGRFDGAKKTEWDSSRGSDSIDRGRSAARSSASSTAAGTNPGARFPRRRSDVGHASGCRKQMTEPPVTAALRTVHACSESKVEMAFPQVELRLELDAFTE